MTAIVRTDARAAAKDRFYRAALWHAADPACSSAYAEFEDAYEALAALGRDALGGRLSRPRLLSPDSVNPHAKEA